LTHTHTTHTYTHGTCTTMDRSSLLAILTLVLFGFVLIDAQHSSKDHRRILADYSSSLVQTRGVGINSGSSSSTSRPTRTPPFLRTPTSHPTIGPSLLPSSRPSTSTADSAALTVTPPPKKEPSEVRSPWTRYLQPFHVGVVQEKDRRVDRERVKIALKMSLEYLLEKKLSELLDTAALQEIALQEIVMAAAARTSEEDLFSFSGQAVFVETEDAETKVPSHAEIQKAQLQILSDLLYELKDLLKENGIYVSTILIYFGGDSTTENEDEEGETKDSRESDVVEATNTETKENSTVVIQNKEVNSPRVYVAVASTIMISLGILLAMKRRRRTSTQEARSNIGGGSFLR
jgi:hypothetical protein